MAFPSHTQTLTAVYNDEKAAIARRSVRMNGARKDTKTMLFLIFSLLVCSSGAQNVTKTSSKSISTTAVSTTLEELSIAEVSTEAVTIMSTAAAESESPTVTEPTTTSAAAERTVPHVFFFDLNQASVCGKYAPEESLRTAEATTSARQLASVPKWTVERLKEGSEVGRVGAGQIGKI